MNPELPTVSISDIVSARTVTPGDALVNFQYIKMHLPLQNNDHHDHDERENQVILCSTLSTSWVLNCNHVTTLKSVRNFRGK